MIKHIIRRNKKTLAQTQTEIKAIPPSGDLDRLLSVAVADRRFCQLLLNNPAQALEKGYAGEKFVLTDAEKAGLLSVKRAKTLTEFVNQFLTNQSIYQNI